MFKKSQKKTTLNTLILPSTLLTVPVIPSLFERLSFFKVFHRKRKPRRVVVVDPDTCSTTTQYGLNKRSKSVSFHNDQNTTFLNHENTALSDTIVGMPRRIVSAPGIQLQLSSSTVASEFTVLDLDAFVDPGVAKKAERRMMKRPYRGLNPDTSVIQHRDREEEGDVECWDGDFFVDGNVKPADDVVKPAMIRDDDRDSENWDEDIDFVNDGQLGNRTATCGGMAGGGDVANSGDHDMGLVIPTHIKETQQTFHTSSHFLKLLALHLEDLDSLLFTYRSLQTRGRSVDTHTSHTPHPSHTSHTSRQNYHGNGNGSGNGNGYDRESDSNSDLELVGLAHSLVELRDLETASLEGLKTVFQHVRRKRKNVSLNPDVSVNQNASLHPNRHDSDCGGVLNLDTLPTLLELVSDTKMGVRRMVEMERRGILAEMP